MRLIKIYEDSIEAKISDIESKILTKISETYRANAEFALKNLRLDAKKCSQMNLGKNHEDYKNLQLFVDGWRVNSMERYHTSEIKWEDIFNDNMKKMYFVDWKKETVTYIPEYKDI